MPLIYTDGRQGGVAAESRIELATIVDVCIQGDRGPYPSCRPLPDSYTREGFLPVRAEPVLGAFSSEIT